MPRHHQKRLQTTRPATVVTCCKRPRAWGVARGCSVSVSVCDAMRSRAWGMGDVRWAPTNQPRGLPGKRDGNTKNDISYFTICESFKSRLTVHHGPLPLSSIDQTSW